MKDIADAALAWLFEDAAPLWSTTGVDRANGGFYDAIGLDGAALPHARRCRSQARQIYSFIELGRLGWNGPWRELAAWGCDFLLSHCRKEGGLYCYSVAGAGGKGDPACANYELAFGLFALAHARRALDRTELEALAAETCDVALERRAHPGGGFTEDENGAGPLLANPHMHLFEASLAWREASPAPRWIAMSDALARLCLERMIDPTTGVLCEHYDTAWRPMPDKGHVRIEPGHLIEWATLLLRWSRMSGVDVLGPAKRLIGFARAHGIDPRREVVVGAVAPDGRVTEPEARLWAQSEWLRAVAMLGEREAGAAPEDEPHMAWNALRRFLATPYPGTWYDVLTADNAFIVEPARATSLYHIVGAVSALAEASGLTRA